MFAAERGNVTAFTSGFGRVQSHPKSHPTLSPILVGRVTERDREQMIDQRTPRMKRILPFAFLALMIVSMIGTAEAKSKRKESKASKDAVEAQAAGPIPAPAIERAKKQADGDTTVVPKPGPIPFGPPVELQLKRADSRRFDLRSLPRTPPVQQERAELPEPPFNPVTIQSGVTPPTQNIPIGPPVPLVQAPPPI